MRAPGHALDKADLDVEGHGDADMPNIANANNRVDKVAFAT